MSLVQFELKFPDLGKKLREARSEIDLFIAAMMQTNRGMLFDSEGAYNGHPKWAPLKFRQGQILSKRGVLRKSLAPPAANGQPGNQGTVRVSGEYITIGTMVFYAALMNFGTTKMPDGVLRPKNKQALKIPTKGKKFILRKSVKIPERRFDTWTDEDEQEMSEALMNKLSEVLSR